jgi:hypothetical protein
MERFPGCPRRGPAGGEGGNLAPDVYVKTLYKRCILDVCCTVDAIRSPGGVGVIATHIPIINGLSIALTPSKRRARTVVGRVNWLGEIRIRSSISQQALAIRLLRDPSWISKTERRPTSWFASRSELVLEWAAACGINPEDEELQEFLRGIENDPQLAVEASAHHAEVEPPTNTPLLQRSEPATTRLHLASARRMLCNIERTRPGCWPVRATVRLTVKHSLVQCILVSPGTS